MEIKDLLQLAVERSASDLHLLSGVPPTLRIEGQLSPVQGEVALTPEAIEKFLKEILSSDQFEKLAANKELDFSLPYSQKS